MIEDSILEEAINWLESLEREARHEVYRIDKDNFEDAYLEYKSKAAIISNYINCIKQEIYE